MAFVIKHRNGTYYRQRTGIGPVFGATLAEAHRFALEADAQQMLGRHYGFLDAEIAPVDDAPKCGAVDPCGEPGCATCGDVVRCPVTGDAAEDCTHVDLDDVELGGEGGGA